MKSHLHKLERISYLVELSMNVSSNLPWISTWRTKMIMIRIHTIDSQPTDGESYRRPHLPIFHSQENVVKAVSREGQNLSSDSIDNGTN